MEIERSIKIIDYTTGPLEDAVYLFIKSIEVVYKSQSVKKLKAKFRNFQNLNQSVIFTGLKQRVDSLLPAGGRFALGPRSARRPSRA